MHISRFLVAWSHRPNTYKEKLSDKAIMKCVLIGQFIILFEILI